MSHLRAQSHALKVEPVFAAVAARCVEDVSDRGPSLAKASEPAREAAKVSAYKLVTCIVTICYSCRFIGTIVVMKPARNEV